MADLYNLEKTVEAIEKQIAVICQMLGIDPTQETTNPDA